MEIRGCHAKKGHISLLGIHSSVSQKNQHKRILLQMEIVLYA
jgi:hypothetical protein